MKPEAATGRPPKPSGPGWVHFRENPGTVPSMPRGPGTLSSGVLVQLPRGRQGLLQVAEKRFSSRVCGRKFGLRSRPGLGLRSGPAARRAPTLPLTEGNRCFLALLHSHPHQILVKSMDAVEGREACGPQAPGPSPTSTRRHSDLWTQSRLCQVGETHSLLRSTGTGGRATYNPKLGEERCGFEARFRGSCP